MSSTPSRSEIESALSGRTKRRKSQPKRSEQAAFDLDIPPRRQQVIGGDLTGVTNRPKQNFFSRYSDIGLPYWIGIGLSLLILAAFFWPQPGDSTREVTEALAKTQSDMISSIEPIPDSEDSSGGTKAFTLDSDIERAAAFREQNEQEQAIQALLATAKDLTAKGRYTQPADDNAVTNYKAILKIDANNAAAKEGLDYIKDRFLASGYKALEQDKESVAKKALTRLESIDRDSSQTSEFANALTTWRQTKKLDDLLARADTALKQDQLILPAQDNALYFYREALSVDKDNERAQKGIESVADTFIARANKAVVEGKYQAAAAHLATVSVIDPDHASIELIEALMSRAKPLADKAEAAASAAQQAAASQNDSTPETVATETRDTDENETSVVSTDPINEPSKNEELEPAGSPTTVASTDRPSTNAQTNSDRTPARQASEQADFDRQYLKQGLEAYYKGEYDTAAALLQPLADKGIARAQFRLAYMHYLGRGFKRDTKESDRMIRAALPAIQKFAEEGRAWAQSDLGSLYEDGLVLPRDFGEAVYWYRSAAEQGYPGAQTNLGMMYARGRGVSSNRRTAIEWFQRAAKQGDSVARRNLDALGVN